MDASILSTPPPWSEPPEATAHRLGVDPRMGLTAQEARERLDRFGPNLLRTVPRRGVGSIVWSQLKSLIVLLLVLAAAVAFFFGEVLEGWAVLVVVLVNTWIGFATELRAVRSMESLQKLVQPVTRVVREGIVQAIAARDLVPGDIVVLEGGDVVTADLRLLEASRLQADESTLTGESLPSVKAVAIVPEAATLAERASLVFKGTSLTRGSGRAVVIGTGMHTELGKVSQLVADSDSSQTPLERRLQELGGTLIWISLAVAAAVVIAGVVAGRDVVVMVETGLALAVAAIPEGLPVVATIAMARSMVRMADRNALIRRLSSVETLGATSIICTDKTGTLTENRITARCMRTDAGEIDWAVAGPQRVLGGARLALEVAVLCNDAEQAREPLGLSTGGANSQDHRGLGDPLELALLEAASLAEVVVPEVRACYGRISEEAFDPEVRMMATVHRTAEGCRVAVKGAPESVLSACTQLQTEDGVRSLTEADRARLAAWNVEMASQGLRVIALAHREVVGSPPADPYAGLTWLALVGLLDPARADVAGAIEECHRAGIRTMMVTGDNQVTATAIGKQVGIPAEDILARVSPAEKLALVSRLQQEGRVVAMTGDGVNDAPALKKADIGIAMGLRGTQVAQEAAHMVLQDDRFPTIVIAVREGRILFDNLRAFVVYLMSCNVSEVMVVGLASGIGSALPILPLQILFLNLVTDVFPALALGVRSGDEDVMSRPPRDPAEPVLDRRHWRTIVFFGVVFSLSVLGALLTAEHVLDYPVEQAVSVSFLAMAFGQLLHVFNMRPPGSSILLNSVTRSPQVWWALAFCTVLVVAAVYIPWVRIPLGIVPPGREGWLLVAAMSALPLIIGQTRLAILRRTHSPG